MSVNEKMTAIADAIRLYTDEYIPMGLDKMAAKIEQVHTKGCLNGQQDFYNLMYDELQKNGTRSDYSYCYAFWTETLFAPKYNMTPRYADGIFWKFQDAIDLAAKLEDFGVTLDFSKCTSLYNAFYNSKIVRVGVIDASSCTSLTGVFSNSFKLETVDNLIVSDSIKYNSVFARCTSLQNIHFSGVIGKNGLSLSDSTKLTHDSLMSIINALSTTTSGLTITLSLTAVNNAFETSTDAADGSTSDEWTALIATKSNWTITLA